MAKSRKLEETLASLNQIRPDPASGTATLRQVLNGKYPIAVAQAARIVGEAAIGELTLDLVAAFDRYMANPNADQGCLAKHSIAEALYRIESRNEDLFLRGIRHIQMESVWGGKDDTAAALRGVCALGLVRMNYPDVMSELADLLADAKPEARGAAAQAIGYSENLQGVPLLRLRVQVGDVLPVLSDCFVALLKLAPTPSLPLVKTFLYARREFAEDTETAEVAALALGESRLPAAFAVLQPWWQQIKTAELRQTALLSIAMLRRDVALTFLLSLVAEGKLQDAKEAIVALNLYRHDEGLRQRLRGAIDQRGEISLLELLDR